MSKLKKSRSKKKATTPRPDAERETVYNEAVPPTPVVPAQPGVEDRTALTTPGRIAEVEAVLAYVVMAIQSWRRQ